MQSPLLFVGSARLVWQLREGEHPPRFEGRGTKVLAESVHAELEYPQGSTRDAGDGSTHQEDPELFQRQPSPGYLVECREFEVLREQATHERQPCRSQSTLPGRVLSRSLLPHWRLLADPRK